ncbi:uba domain-containing 7 [Trichoderma cornu-damae]|uniref:Uba domain-containing 7 n=1 Tax=Trichoderma cornu-damae TaxID=654480 RepID=A0A9P8QTV8_9HYPO|nr:uba domain-containing 7 [Trichoderma cornu-damae]
MDDLSGLDWSSDASGSKPKPMLANPSYPPFRSSPSPLGTGQSTPVAAQKQNGPVPKATPAKAAQDSFSNLSFGLPKATQNLSLAERQAQLEVEKRRRDEERRKIAEAQFGNGQHWDTLGSRGFAPGPAPQQQPATAKSAANDDDDDLFAAFNRDTKVDNASHYPPPPPNKNKLDLADPSAWGSTAASSGGGTFEAEDDDPFGLDEVKPAASTGGGRGATASTDDFDFLGDLGRPVDEIRREQQAKQEASRGEPGKPIEDDSSSSDDDEPIERNTERVPRVNKDPFDKAVAQLVDYGFTPEQARRGLVESGTGFNAQAAANWLLDEAHRKSKEASQTRGSQEATGGQNQRSDSRSPARGETDFAKTAAAMGSTLFKSANTLWKTGQKKMQQAVAEFQQDGDPSQPKWMRDAQQARAQPRPPQRATADVTDEALMLESGGRPQPQPARSSSSSTRPAVDPRAGPPISRGSSPAPSSGTQSRNSPAPRWQQQAQPPPMVPDARSRLNRLTEDDDDSFSSYVSASRRKKATPAPEPRKPEPEPDLLFGSQTPKPSQQTPFAASQRPTQAAPSRPQPAPAPAPPRKVTPRPARQVPPISPQALQASTTHRLQGTTHFKRGDYAAAHTSYSSSLSSVPPTHPLMIVLLTNRALTALKTGEPKQAVADADGALKIIGPGNGQGETVSVRNETGQEESRDMKELYGKALSRKAEALEQMEKWAEAAAVWRQCVEGGVGGATAVKGRQRCQDALAPKPKPAPRPAAKPRPQPSAAAAAGRAPQRDSEAVTRLREANQAAAKEDDEKFALADKVDAKVSAWRDGKRENLRALLASMDQVLWENSGWKKVGLHELVMANKVKISYMKAIAKTHPDKLPQDASTEVRLIAGLVFSTLNESWDKFKAENGL